jgi:hypothetical protein
MSRRADALGYWVTDADIRDLQRIAERGPITPSPRVAPKADPMLDYAMRITAGCPCERCLQRQTCRAECETFTAWIRHCDRGRSYPKPATH